MNIFEEAEAAAEKAAAKEAAEAAAKEAAEKDAAEKAAAEKAVKATTSTRLLVVVPKPSMAPLVVKSKVPPYWRPIAKRMVRRTDGMYWSHASKCWASKWQ